MKSFFLRKPVSACLAVAFLLFSTGWAQADTNCYLLSVGVDDYTQINDLRGCVNDARNTTNAFTSQRGRLFRTVKTMTLVDRQATRANIGRYIGQLSRMGSAGDFVVIFLSGHGGKSGNGWYFCPADYNNRGHAQTALTGGQLLHAVNPLVRQGKKVFIIVDACYSGALRNTAQQYFRSHQGTRGGLVLLLSSTAQQTSMALGSYSAFAKAVADGYAGHADLNRDGSITLTELSNYSSRRANELIRQRGHNRRQDAVFGWSPTVSQNMSIAKVSRNAVAKSWAGQETLKGFGRLEFRIHGNGRVTMVDARSTMVGAWRQQGNRMTLSFDNGRVTYTGYIVGQVMTGTARNGNTTWTWVVRKG